MPQTSGNFTTKLGLRGRTPASRRDDQFSPKNMSKMIYEEWTEALGEYLEIHPDHETLFPEIISHFINVNEQVTSEEAIAFRDIFFAKIRESEAYKNRLANISEAITDGKLRLIEHTVYKQAFNKLMNTVQARYENIDVSGLRLLFNFNLYPFSDIVKKPSEKFHFQLTAEELNITEHTLDSIIEKLEECRIEASQDCVMALVDIYERMPEIIEELKLEFKDELVDEPETVEIDEEHGPFLTPRERKQLENYLASEARRLQVLETKAAAEEQLKLGREAALEALKNKPANISAPQIRGKVNIPSIDPAEQNALRKQKIIDKKLGVVNRDILNAFDVTLKSLCIGAAFAGERKVEGVIEESAAESLSKRFAAIGSAQKYWDDLNHLLETTARTEAREFIEVVGRNQAELEEVISILKIEALFTAMDARMFAISAQSIFLIGAMREVMQELETGIDVSWERISTLSKIFETLVDANEEISLILDNNFEDANLTLLHTDNLWQDFMNSRSQGRKEYSDFLLRTAKKTSISCLLPEPVILSWLNGDFNCGAIPGINILSDPTPNDAMYLNKLGFGSGSSDQDLEDVAMLGEVNTVRMVQASINLKHRLTATLIGALTAGATLSDILLPRSSDRNASPETKIMPHQSRS